MDLTNYIKSGFPFLAIETFEIKRALNVVSVDEKFKKLHWNLAEGLNIPNGNKYADLMELFKFGIENPETMILLENFNLLWDDEMVTQSILNHMSIYEKQQTMFVVIGSNLKFPSQLDKIVTRLELPFPTPDEFKTFALELCEQTGIEYNQRAVDACKGLSFEEGKNTLTLTIVENKQMVPETIMEIKKSMLRKTGFLDYLEPVPIEDVGGLEQAKKFFYKRLEKWGDQKFPKLQSVFLGGLSGTGKSLLAKALSSIFNCPLIIWDINATKGGLVGDTERNMRLATKTIDAFGMCIVLVDEVEKVFSGSTGQFAHSTDAGIMAHWLTWTQESKSEKIIVCTANEISNLPPEFMRRFDVSFFVDFPNKSAIKDIIDIMNKRYGSNIPTNSSTINSLIGWSGSEIERLAKDSLFDEFHEAYKNVPLLKNIKGAEIESLRSKYKMLMREANSVDDLEDANVTRLVTINEKENEKEYKSKFPQKIPKVNLKKK